MDIARDEEVMIERETQPANAAASSSRRKKKRPAPHTAWAEHIPDNEWAIYESAIHALQPLERPFMLAGAFSLATYTGSWRNTKDLDLYVLPDDRQLFIDALTRAGFADYYEQLPYLRHWIYRAFKDDCIVDIIWAHANRRADVDEQWFERAPEVNVRGRKLAVVPAEELLWCKLYVMQKDRCDWGDVMNLVHATDGNLDWEHLSERLGEDLPLLIGLLNVYCWLHPGNQLRLPQSIRAVLPHCCAANGERVNQRNVDLLDTRPWFVGAPNRQKGG
jgi:hypothetical protein